MSGRTLTALVNKARWQKTAVPLVCPCGSDVELAGEGMGGAMRCNACGDVHPTLSTLRRRKA